MAGLSYGRVLLVAYAVLLLGPHAFVNGFVGGPAFRSIAHLSQAELTSQRRDVGCGVMPRMFFGGTSGSMPKLYDGWFKKTGQIQKDIVETTKSALR